MRPSLKSKILDASVEYLGLGGSITFEAVAKHAGITKGGLLYHFPTRDALVLGIVRHVAEKWEREMLDQLGKPFDQASHGERMRAYVTVASLKSGEAGEHAVYSDAIYRDYIREPWVEIFYKWFDLSDVSDPALRARLTAARFAADGLWHSDATGIFAASTEDRNRIIQLIIGLTL